tara:strand:- start:1709 stop:2908 length:1200 start_codon:yes stop_codon:yes gene_type:complete
MSDVMKSMTLLPDYQETFLKNLLANIYQVGEDGKTITGIAAKSPLEGTAMTDAEGNPLYEKADGTGFTTDPTLAKTDQYGDPVQGFEGGVAAPDIIKFTDAQKQALQMFGGQYDDQGNLIAGTGGIGSYKPFLDQAKQTQAQGLAAFQQAVGTPLFDSEGQPIYQKDEQGNVIYDSEGKPVQQMQGGFADPSQYKKFYDPYVESVIDTTQADIQKAGDISKIADRAKAVGAGAYGGSRQALVEQQTQSDIEDRKAQVGAQLRSKAFGQAMDRGQSAAQLFGQLGKGLGSLGIQQGALGEAAQSQLLKDVNALFNVGSLEQGQLQSEFDVQRAGQLEQAYEPFGRFAFMRDILSGVPTGQSSFATTYTPQINPVGNIFSMAQNIAQTGQSPFGLGSFMGG